jgi:hypothetical protein
LTTVGAGLEAGPWGNCVLWGVNIVFLLYGGHIIDIYDGCLNVADYLCGR